ncbi:MAG TPA: hypothetical protein VNL17_15430 [Verrucomicrobiae bacterium]|nr:hypothetical protein [Verrucomicrobiae bacterium]
MQKFIVVWCLLGLLYAGPVMACDLCAVYAATEAQGRGDGGWYGGVAGQFTYYNTLQSGGHTVGNDGEYIDSLVSQVFVGYNINDRFGVQANLPVIYRAYGSSAGGNHDESGIGDLSLIGNYLIYQKIEEDFTFNWTALGGIKFPTGSAEHLNPNEPDFSTGIGGHDLTMGSGSYDGLIGTGVFARWKRLFLTANMQYTIRSAGAFDYQIANDLSWNGGPGIYLVLGHKHTLAGQFVVSGETKGQDTVQGVPTDDTAETIVYVGPQINFTWSTRLSAQVGADLPVSIRSTGDQLVPNYRTHAALTWRF